MRVVYIDSLFLLNAVINYVVLLCAARVCGIAAGRARLAVSAALGGFYAVGASLFGFLQSPVLKLACGAAMTLAAFGGERRLLRITLVFFAVSAAFGGAVYAASLLRGGAPGISIRTLLASFAVCWAVFSVVFRRLGRVHTGACTAEVTLSLAGRTVRLTALRDTGNSLSDPATGSPLVVIEKDAAARLLPPGQAAIFDGDAASAALSGDAAGLRVQLIPYSAVGVSGGLLPAFRVDSAVVDGREIKRPLAAVSPTGLSDGGGYSALIGGKL